jgi:hypothetical protein
VDRWLCARLHVMADATSHNVTLRWEKSRELNSDFCRHSTRDSVSAFGVYVSNLRAFEDNLFVFELQLKFSTLFVT